MAKINVLPRDVAELIAAGEVIERPASIVKELVENSIDAGATDITVEIQYGGVRYLRVTDNGCGIAREDAPKAFLRHATSKVRTADDLDSIGTLGFRGEALASIAAVAHVEMLTKVKDAVIGTLVQISGSEVQEVSDTGCPDGTTIIIRDVFYNVPARLKFLKKDTTESGAVASIVDKIALSHPEISVSFIKDGKQMYRTPGSGDLMGAIYTVLGRDFAKAMLPVEYKAGAITVSGYICRPMSARSNRSMQHFFVNGRYTKTRTCGVALEEGYRGSIMVGKFPSCVLMLDMPCELVDVNVHPAKIEVRFQSEKSVFDAVYFAVKSTIRQDGQIGPNIQQETSGHDGRVLSPFYAKDEPQQLNIGGQAPQTKTFETMDAAQFRQRFAEPGAADAPPSEPAPQGRVPGAKIQLREEWLPRKNTETMLDVEADPADFESLPERVTGKDREDAKKRAELERRSQAQHTETEHKPKAPSILGGIPDGLELLQDIGRAEAPVSYHAEKQEEASQKAEMIHPERQSAPSVEIFGEVFSTYILCRIDAEFVMIDKHAAHERILYNKLRSQGEELERQMLLAPVSVTLSRTEHQLVLEQSAQLLKLGFEAEDFGGSTVLLRSVPALMADASPQELFLDAVDGLSHAHAGVTAADDILHRMACRSAVKGGDHNNAAELRELVQVILNDENVRYCPHGRPVMVRFTRREIEKMFGRIQ